MFYNSQFLRGKPNDMFRSIRIIDEENDDDGNDDEE
jgi:hypothetical protein